MTRDANTNAPNAQAGAQEGIRGTGEPVSEAAGPLIQPDVVERCEKVVQEYRLGNVDKTTAILELTRAIPNDADKRELFDRAFRSYCSMLDSFERFREGAREKAPVPVTTNGTQPSDTQESSAQIDLQAGGSAAADKRARSSEPEEDAHPSKKRVDVNQLPWLAGSKLAAANLPESLRVTQSLLENFSRDPKYTKSTIVNAFDCPQFPETEWTNLIAGRAVDLDHVLSGLFTITQATRKAERFGDLEIEFGTAAPAKTVKTHGDWVSAWQPTVDATIYVFPHRETELRSYGRHILQLFAASPVELHPNIVNYDKAIRIRTAQRRDLLLTDTHAFGDLFMYWIQNAKPARQTRGSQGRKGEGSSSNKRRDPCRRYNEARCPNSNNSCNYAHVCAKCRGNDHIESECGKKSV
jgi:hypothetical protein